jgi:hypothetical protein
MPTRFPFFELKTPADLFRKLESDLTALQASSQDTRLAFNFFVTAEHLPDWLGKRALVSQHAILRVVSHIANGAKHFSLDDHRHQAVTSTEKFQYVEDGYIEPGYFDEPLIINLSQREAAELGASTIDAVALGSKVIQFWRPYVQAA